jgi:hypothetical protein
VGTLKDAVDGGAADGEDFDEVSDGVLPIREAAWLWILVRKRMQPGPEALRSLPESDEDRAGPGHRLHGAGPDRSDWQGQDVPAPRLQHRGGVRGSDLRPAQRQTDQARVVGRRLAASGKPLSRRALRRAGVRGSNETLNALARMINAERAGPSEARETANDDTGSTVCA